MERRHRLRRGEDFQRLHRDALAYQHPFLAIRVKKNGLDHNRYGIVTSKQLGNAVTRNRVKRVIREVIRHFHPQLGSGVDVVIIARKAIVTQPYAVIRQALAETMAKAGLL